ncbi:MAG: phenylalanine--tRNA ligase subunit beta, partial [Pirellulales bacterium]|nr:phenylalanine--tRNA ligase subunit beta [Pirellulales bacterium]
IELFEIAKVYLPHGKKLPVEERMLGITSGRGFAEVKGAIESILTALNPAVELEAVATDVDLLDPAKSCELRLAGKTIGYLGELLTESLKRFELRQPATVSEIRVADLLTAAELIPQFKPLPAYPAMSRDLNLVVDDSVHWADIAATVRDNCEQYYESLEYQDTYRDANRLGKGKKSLLMSLNLRWSEGTMTNQEADRVRDKIVAACKDKHGAELRA